MYYKREWYTWKKNQKMTKSAFTSYVSQITNNQIMNILAVDDRFTDTVIDSNKLYLLRLNLKYKKKKLFIQKSKCIVTNRHRAKIRFLGSISRFQLKEMVCDGKLLVGISRFGW